MRTRVLDPGTYIEGHGLQPLLPVERPARSEERMRAIISLNVDVYLREVMWYWGLAQKAGNATVRANMRRFFEQLFLRLNGEQQSVAATLIQMATS